MRKNNQFTPYFKKFDQSFYVTGAYDDYLQQFKKEGLTLALKIIKELKPTPSWRFLDIGCGLGGFILALRSLGFQAWGTEVSPYCLRHSPAQKWIRFGNVTHLLFPNNSFEFVSCIDVLYYLNHQEFKQAINELCRVTQNYLYIDTISPGSPNSRQNFNPDILRKNKYLLTIRTLKKIFADHQFFFLRPLFKSETDFNGLFVKGNSPLISHL